MKSCVLLLGGVLIGGAAWGADSIGDDTVGQWYVTPQLGDTVTDGSRHVDDGLFYGLAIGRHLNEDWSAEINVLSGKYDGHYYFPDLRLTPISIDALRVFDRGAMFSPYITGGIGTILDNPSGLGSQTDFLAQAGVGALVHLAESADGSVNFSLRPEFKVRWDSDGTYHRPFDEIIGVGFEFAFGTPRPVQTAAVVSPSAPAPVPAPTAAPEAAAPPPPSAPPAPPPPAQNVLPTHGSITLVGVHFENNSARLTADSAVALDPVAAALEAHAGVRVELQGYTDGIGSGPYNLRLSQARADAVRDYLVAHGVPADQLATRGYGKAQPIADNRTAEGRAQNRRVVMRVLDNPNDLEIRQSDDR